MWTKLQVVGEKPLIAKHVKWVHKGLWEPCTAELRGLSVSHWDVSNFTAVRTCHYITWPDPSITAHDAEYLSRSRLHQRNNGLGNLYSGLVLGLTIMCYKTWSCSSVSFPGQYHSPKASGIVWERVWGPFWPVFSTVRRDSRTPADPGMGGTRDMHNPLGNRLVSWL